MSRRVHFIGICGTAMATVAAMLKKKGIDVRGSDQDVYPPMSDFLAKEGIPFAFATDGVDRLETVPANLRQIIGAGLKPDDALAALTTHAAAIAGVERRLGTLEPGKLGHVVVMTAPFHEERAKVKYVLVDGLKLGVKPEEAARAKAKGGGFRGRGGRGEPVEKAPPEDEGE